MEHKPVIYVVASNLMKSIGKMLW